MGMFKKDDPTTALKNAITKIEKEKETLFKAQNRSRAAIDRVMELQTKLAEAKEIAIDAAARGEEPPSTAKLETELRDAQSREAAFAAAVTRAEGDLGCAQAAFEDAKTVERDHRYAAVAKRLETKLDEAAHIHAELIDIWTEDPKHLPVLAWPELGLGPDARLHFWKIALSQFISPPVAPVMPKDQILVRFTKSVHGGPIGTVGSYSKGETAGFPEKTANKLIAEGYCVAA